MKSEETVRKMPDVLSCDQRPDPVDRMIRDLTPAETVAWLVRYKGLSEDVADNVESNLRESFKWQRLQGRLDQTPWLAVLASLWGLRSEVSRLETPKK